MKRNEKGFGVVEILVIILILGLLGTIGWLVYDRQVNKTDNNKDLTAQQKDSTPQIDKELDFKTLDGVKYTVPSGWKSVKAPYEPYEADGPYLLSPDYKEAGLGQLSITTGAYITFRNLEWTGIDSSTSVEQAAAVVKNGEGGYLDASSVKTTTIADKQVVIFNAGHTTDGVTVFYKTSSNTWLDTSFSTTSGNDASYNAQDSAHYKTFLSWLEEFIKLNP